MVDLLHSLLGALVVQQQLRGERQREPGADTFDRTLGVGDEILETNLPVRGKRRKTRKPW